MDSQSKESKKTTQPINISAERAVWTSFTLDILDILTNAVAAIISGSVVMLVETLQGFADLISDGFVLIGLRRSRKPSDKSHPLGYGGELFVWTLFAAVIMITVLSVLSIYSGWQRIIHPREITNLPLTFAILFFSMASNGYSLSLSTRRIFRGNYSAMPRRFYASPMVESKAVFTTDIVGTLSAFFWHHRHFSLRGHRRCAF